MYGSPPCLGAASNHPSARLPGNAIPGNPAPLQTREGRHLAAPLATSLARSSSLGNRSRYGGRRCVDVVRVGRIAGSGVIPGPLHLVGLRGRAVHRARKAAPRVTVAEKSSRAGFEVWVLGTLSVQCRPRPRADVVRPPVNRTVAEPPVLVAGLLHPVVGGHRSARVDREAVVGSPLEDHRARGQVRRSGTVDPSPLTLPAGDRKALPSLGGLPSAPGPHCSYAAEMFLPVSSDEGQDGIPARLSAMSSSNRRLTLVVSLVAGVNCERTRMPRLDVLVRRSDRRRRRPRWSESSRRNRSPG